MSGKIHGKVVSIRDSGDAVTDIAMEQLDEAPTDENVSIQCEGHVTSCIFPAHHDQQAMTYLAKHGETGWLELSLVGDSVQAFLGIQSGSRVTVQW